MGARRTLEGHTTATNQAGCPKLRSRLASHCAHRGSPSPPKSSAAGPAQLRGSKRPVATDSEPNSQPDTAFGFFPTYVGLPRGAVVVPRQDLPTYTAATAAPDLRALPTYPGGCHRRA